MMVRLRHIALTLMLAAGFISLAGQDLPGGFLRIADGKLVLSIRTDWTHDQMRQATRQFGLDSMLISKLIAGEADSILIATGWTVDRKSGNTLEISRPIVIPPQVNIPDIKLDFPVRPFLLDDRWLPGAWQEEPEPAACGVNDFADTTAFRYLDSVATFNLSGYPDASRVTLSGSFNGWSTGGPDLARTETGWTVSLPLKPGKYQYKFIVDGRWTRDPANRQRQDDLNGAYNSVVFCYNYRFALPGYAQARRVFVAGSFNGYRPDEYRMRKTDGGWELPLYLSPGTHGYKFVVDGEWITDPANPVVRPDGRGNFNSFLGIGDTTLFRLEGFRDARQVILSGSFNGWNTAELRMDRASGGWELPYVLPPGNYEYKFIADGRWMTDPANPFTNGQGETTNSLLSVQPNHLFTVDSFPDARQVVVTGSFTRWNPGSYRMLKRNGRWELPIRLNPGKVTYKIVVDGEWMLDPGNPLWEENEYGTGNSVLWIEK